MGSYEQLFINSCIVKEKRERLLFELCGKRRRDGIGRFCHDTETMLIHGKIALKGPVSKEELIQHLGEKSLSLQCHIAAYNTDIDGRDCSVSEALDAVLSNGMAAIIITDAFAVIETEQCVGTPMRYIVRY